MKKASKKSAPNKSEQRWVLLLTLLSLAAVVTACAFVVWHAVSK